MINGFRISLVSGIMALSLAVPSVVMSEDLSKKLINFGWDMLPPDRLEKKIGELQHLPFDGLTVRATDFCYPFFNKHVDGAAVEANVEAMSKIQWGKFTDNFMYLTAAAEGQWFDDQAWSNDGAIIKNVRAIARMGRAGRCKGILFDPEFVYWGQPVGPWQYAKQAQHQEKGLEEYRGMVRRRGRQFMDAIEAEMPNPVFLSLFWGSLGSFRQLAYDTDPKIVNEVIGGEYYGLLHDFMLGMLEAADIGTTIIDGNESSYYANDFESYMSAYHFIHQTMLGAIPEELRYKYRAQVSAGHAIYADWHSNTRGQHTLATYLTPAERAIAMEWVVYHALKSSDKYVWFYTERPQYLNGVQVASELPSAIDRARQNVAQNKPVGVDYLPLRKRAGDAYNQAQFAAVKPSQSVIVRTAQVPKIDGKLEDSLWKSAFQLGTFQNYRTAVNPLETTTTAQMAYDETHLYVAVRCEDPAMDKISVSDLSKVEGEPWMEGSLVQVAIAVDEAASKYYCLTVAYNNQRWDSLTPRADYPKEIDGKNSSWDGEYETATQTDKSGWSVEMAIPWTALNRPTPKTGDQIKGNLRHCAGRRESHNQNEFSSWSLMILPRNIEARSMGTWEFR